MRFWYFITIALLIIVSNSPGLAKYKDLASAWEEWTPPQYDEYRGGKTRAAQLNQANETAPISGQNIWTSRVKDLQNLGSFVTPIKAHEKPLWPVEQAKVAIGSVIRMDEIESMVMARNPAVISAIQTLRAERDGFDQVRDLDAVLRRYEAFTTGIKTGVGPMKGRSNISRSYPFPGRFALKSQIIVENASLAALTLNIVLRDKITDVRISYWDLNLIHEKLTIFQETLALFEQLHDIASTLYKTGKTSYQDVIQIVIRKEIVENKIATLVEKRRAVGARLLSVLNLPPDTPLGRPNTGPPETTIPKAGRLVDQALEERQEILSMDHAIAKMELMIEMAESMVLPPIDLGLSTNRLSQINTTGTWARSQAFPGQGPNGTIKAAMGGSQPQRPWFGSAASWLSQTRKKLVGLRYKKANIEAQTRALVQSAWFNLDDALRTYFLYKNSIIGLSASALDVATKEYETGSVSFAQTAGAYNNWLNARLSFARATRDTAVFRATLQKTVGVSF